MFSAEGDAVTGLKFMNANTSDTGGCDDDTMDMILNITNTDDANVSSNLSPPTFKNLGIAHQNS